MLASVATTCMSTLGHCVNFEGAVHGVVQVIASSKFAFQSLDFWSFLKVISDSGLMLQCKYLFSTYLS